MNTDDCILSAFSGESRVNRKYNSFAKIAADEGYDHVANLFRATSAAEEVHSHRLLSIGGYLGNTAANIEAGIIAELRASTESYPKFVTIAEKEDRQEAVVTFTYAMKAEAAHAELYKKALEAVKAGKDFEVKTIYLCPVCGNVVINKTPERCPICGIPGESFRVVE
ncbi:MAG: rubrerythrin family protein [Methanocorpusculum sp.]|uniref:rubrerythrin family protein n=1 Tax=Methanocorpusculum sp. TaxID=2058474 RepID=UPI002724B489|nr:rubrerythrin family protein [Methanocorpusculum sp.]MDO9522934.1 rubrerythrin family protein [Methanocorpusculum sp.]